MQAMTATLLISAAPVFILLFIPVHNAAQNKNLLNILLAFAMGGLLGDVFLHLLPHSFSGHSHESHVNEHHEHHDHHGHVHEHHEHHDHDHVHDHEHEHHGHSHEHENEHVHEHHDHSDHGHVHEHHDHDDHEHEHHGHSLEGVMTGIWIIVGIFTFFIVEKSIRNMTGGHGHSHSAPPKHEKKETKNEKDEKKSEGLRQRGKQDKKTKKEKTEEKHNHVSKVSGFLNLAADFTHNFTDGLAIGATFVAGERMGMITTVAILLHEVPHEIGDFAILVSSGFTKWQAMKLQFVTAIGALIGTAVGIMTGGLASASNVILPVTAGGFIYISTVSVIPQLLEDCASTKQTILELIAACVGVGLMTIIALME